MLQPYHKLKLYSELEHDDVPATPHLEATSRSGYLPELKHAPHAFEVGEWQCCIEQHAFFTPPDTQQYIMARNMNRVVMCDRAT